MATVRRARSADLESLGTLHARAFHKISPWHAKTFPDTEIVRKWWRDRYAQDIADDGCHILVVTETPSSNEVAGVCCLRYIQADERGAGRWTTYAPSEHHPAEQYRAMVASMAENREKLMLGRQHFLLEHLGVDLAYQRSGFGTLLIDQACSLSREKSCDIFVQANEFAAPFYKKHNFTLHGSFEMPGGLGEFFMLYSANSKNEE